MSTGAERRPVILGLGQGRGYDCGTMTAIFKADGPETQDRYSVSEWWLDPGSKGPGAHLHEENDELFFVVEGTPSILVGATWYDAPTGSFIMIPANTLHDFENRSEARAGLLNVFIPGGFEKNMPMIVDWFAREKSGTQTPPAAVEPEVAISEPEHHEILPDEQEFDVEEELVLEPEEEPNEGDSDNERDAIGEIVPTRN